MAKNPFVYLEPAFDWLESLGGKRIPAQPPNGTLHARTGWLDLLDRAPCLLMATQDFVDLHGEFETAADSDRAAIKKNVDLKTILETMERDLAKTIATMIEEDPLALDFMTFECGYNDALVEKIIKAADADPAITLKTTTSYKTKAFTDTSFYHRAWSVVVHEMRDKVVKSAAHWTPDLISSLSTASREEAMSVKSLVAIMGRSGVAHDTRGPDRFRTSATNCARLSE